MEKRNLTDKIILKDYEANPDAVWDLLDDVGSDFEFEDDDGGDDWEPNGEEPFSGEDDESSENEDIPEASTSSAKPNSAQKLFWKKANFKSDDNSQEVHVDPVEVSTPWGYFQRYLNNEFFELSAVHTCQYYLQKNGRQLKPTVTAEEIKKFFGMHAIMGCIKFPRIHLYWSSKFKFPIISDAMPRDRFYCLRVNFHIVDNYAATEETKKNNRLWRVQPMIDLVRNRCHAVERYSESSFSIDEQMVPFLGRCALRQYVKNKPRPVGLKNFVLTTSDGTVLDFKIYQGSTTPFKNKELGLGPSVVIRLVETLPAGSFIFFDRYFSTVPLFNKLLELQIKGTATIMSNRFKGYTFKKDSSMKRGESEQIVRSDEKMCVTKWKDNKSVLMASTAFGVEPLHTVKRWDKATKKFIEVSCPNVVKTYNEKMGGVDICDQMIECYRTFFKTRKWTLKVILHLFDLTIVNSWMEYRKDCRNNQYRKQDIKDLLDFRMELGEYLLCGSKNPRSDINDESEVEEGEPTHKKAKPSPLPCTDKRYDGFNHWPVHEDIKNPLCCRLESCSSRSRVSCGKCKVYLCLNKTQNCFYKFHTK